MLFICVFFSFMLLQGIYSCEDPIFLVDGPRGVLDSMITASSFHTNNDRRPYYCRLNNSNHWAPDKASVGEWIEVELWEEATVISILLQCSSSPIYYVTRYRFMYSDNGVDWLPILVSASEAYIGVTSGEPCNISESVLSAPVHAKYIRIYPIEWVAWPSLRFDVEGCYDRLTTAPFISSTSSSRTSSSLTAESILLFTTSPQTSPVSSSSLSIASEISELTSDMPTTYSSRTVSANSLSCYCKTCLNQTKDATHVAQQMEIFQKIINENKIQKKMTSRNKRSKISIPDDRTSSKVIGSLGITVLVTVTMLISASDIGYLFIFVVNKLKIKH